jgi:hypothetical protein
MAMDLEGGGVASLVGCVLFVKARSKKSNAFCRCF